MRKGMESLGNRWKLERKNHLHTPHVPSHVFSHFIYRCVCSPSEQQLTELMDFSKDASGYLALHDTIIDLVSFRPSPTLNLADICRRARLCGGNNSQLFRCLLNLYLKAIFICAAPWVGSIPIAPRKQMWGTILSTRSLCFKLRTLAVSKSIIEF